MLRARGAAIWAHIALFDGDDATLRKLLPSLWDCFETRMPFTDHPAYVAALSLERLEGRGAATAFVERFINTYRVERWTPRRQIMQYLDADA